MDGPENGRENPQFTETAEIEGKWRQWHCPIYVSVQVGGEWLRAFNAFYLSQSGKWDGVDRMLEKYFLKNHRPVVKRDFTILLNHEIKKKQNVFDFLRKYKFLLFTE